MGRSMIAGMTDYSYQSFDDMILDLRTWIENLKEVSRLFSVNMQKLQESNYWAKVNVDFQYIVERSIKFHGTSIQEIPDIVSEIQEEVRPDHIARIRRLYTTACELDFEYGRIWHQGYTGKEYDNESFKLAEELYAQGREMAIDMRDLSNLATRLEDFVGKKAKQKSQVQQGIDMLELKPNFCGLGININEVIKKFIRRK